MINHKLEILEGVSYLKQIREKAKLTQQDLASKLGVAERTISRWETGTSPAALTAYQWKTLYKEVLSPLGIDFLDVPDDLGAPYIKAA